MAPKTKAKAKGKAKAAELAQHLDDTANPEAQAKAKAKAKAKGSPPAKKWPTAEEDEKNRWLILHFALPRTIMSHDMEQIRTTEQELNSVLATQAWGAVERGNFVLKVQEPSLEMPDECDDTMITYANHVDRMYPSGPDVDEADREDNRINAEMKKSICTESGEPVEAFRKFFDNVIKSVTYTNKAMIKAYQIPTVILNEDDVPEDFELSDALNILRYGRFQIVPAFWHFLIHLINQNRIFSLVFRTWNRDHLPPLKRELNSFCVGGHPAYNGLNRTTKPPLMNGENLSLDIRLEDHNVGFMSRTDGTLRFPGRDESGIPLDPIIGEDGKPEYRDVDHLTYRFPPFQDPIDGLMNRILHECNSAAIVDDFDYWVTKDRTTLAGKYLWVNYNGGLPETHVQHIFFDGNIQSGNGYCVDVRDIGSGNPQPFDDVDKMFMWRVDFRMACLDIDYFIKALRVCEKKLSQMAGLSGAEVGDEDSQRDRGDDEDGSGSGDDSNDGKQEDIKRWITVKAKKAEATNKLLVSFRKTTVNALRREVCKLVGVKHLHCVLEINGKELVESREKPWKNFNPDVDIVVWYEGDRLKRILDKRKLATINNVDRFERSVLHFTAIDGDFELITEAADHPQFAMRLINKQDVFGDSALHLSSILGHEDIVEFLLDKQANPDLQNVYHRTPTMLAAEHGHHGAIRALLRNGARLGPNPGKGVWKYPDPEYLAHHNHRNKVIREVERKKVEDKVLQEINEGEI